MKTLTFGIRPLDDSFRDFKEAFEAARNRTPFKARIGSYFTSIEALRNFLTPKRLALLHTIKERHPSSIYVLARMVDRSFASVHKDVGILAKHGLIKLGARASKGRRAVQPTVQYDAINILIGV